jgi:hypothetical protein
MTARGASSSAGRATLAVLFEYSKLHRALLTLLLLAVPLRAARAADAVQFTIESISIEGVVHASPQIIVAESRLREGQTYTESDLRDAIARIDRLPFVLSSEFRLARGTVPGRYVLIVTIRETRPIFVSALSRSIWVPSFRITGPAHPPDPPPTEAFRRDFHNYQATAGARWFAGAKGLASVATDVVANELYRNEDASYPTSWNFTAGFTQYDLFGSRASLTAIVAYHNRRIPRPPLFDNDIEWRSRYDLSYQLVALVPIAANQSILASWQWRTDPITYAGPSGNVVTLHTRPLGLDAQQIAWRYDTTDDPLFPTAGTLVRASISRNEFAYFDTNTVRHLKYDRTDDAAAQRFWQLTTLQSVSAGIDYERAGVASFRPHAGYSASLWTRDRTLRFGDLRAEIEIDRLFIDPFGSARGSVSNLRTGFAFRNEWGVVRATFQYAGWSNR